MTMSLFLTALLAALLPPAGAPDADPPGLPLSLSSWGESQVTRASAPSSRVEVNLFAGGVLFEDEFESDPFVSGGVMLRLPTPWLPTGRIGLFAEFLVSKMERELEPLYENSEGMFYGVALGADFSIVRTPSWYLLLQGGAIYLTFGDIRAVDDGWGGVAGLAVGFSLNPRDTRTALTFNPQFAYEGDDWFFFVHVGLNFQL